MLKVSKEGRPNRVTVITEGKKTMATIRRAKAKTFLLTLKTGKQPFTSAMFGTPTNCTVFSTRNKAIKEALIQIEREEQA